MPRRKTPTNDDEWQIAVDMAEGALALDSARQYGLVTGGPVVNADRCSEILDDGKKRGIVPSPDAVETFVKNCALERYELQPDPTLR